MSFIDYLKNRHLHIEKANRIGDTSARQYKSRLENLIDKGIYIDEGSVTSEISEMIKGYYVNKTGEYERTLRYYIEYRKHIEKQ
ncbi:hypothetical protein [Jeotgalibacillus proteolyticus]|uniref:hypothetical protein n=1 Tax=Jeotgalibacillus proteolyticus TaxID=2082395 RepID=UPI003CEFE2F4